MERTKIIIQDKLIKLGITPANRGFHYLERAIELLNKEQFMLMMDLYEKVALDFGTTASRVERACRHAIQCSFDMNTPMLSEYFGDITPYNKDKVPVSTFIHVVLLHIKREEEAERDLKEMGIEKL